MFNKSLLVALLSLSVAVSAAPKNAEKCDAPKTVTATVVVTAAAGAATTRAAIAVSSAAAANNGKGGNKATTAAAAAATNIAQNNAGEGGAVIGNAAAGAAAGAGAAGAAGAAAGANNAAAGAAAGAAGAATATADADTSLTLDPAVLATGFFLDGQQTPTAGQVASLTSKNNFINFCKDKGLPITNGQQIKTGSCNPAPMGIIAAATNIPSTKFVNPPNFGTIKANTPFTIDLAVKNIVLGNFVNAQASYFAGPQTVDKSGNIIGHTHVVIEALKSIGDTDPLDPLKFAFFKGVNDAQDAKGQVHVPVAAGLPAGVYRLSTIQSSSNHQPVLVAIAQHGSCDDAIYFTVTADGVAAGAAGAAGANNAGAAAPAGAAVTAATGAQATAAPATGATGAAGFALKNGQDAIALNKKFLTAKAGDACTDTTPTCAADQLAQCVGGKLVVSACAPGTVCRALPLVNSAGTSVSCDTAADADARIKATGATTRRRRSFSVRRRS